MRLLLDTHVLLWFLREPHKLSPPALAAIASASQVGVSIVSLWEIAIKVSLNKLQLPKSYDELFPQSIIDSGLDLLPVDPTHLSHVVGLPWHHRDPFDRLLVAQAKAEGVTLISADASLGQYSVPVLW
jgi:PIN domain nuclease of toxin-antitoxin system